MGAAHRGGRIHTRLGCREVLFDESDGEVEVTGLRLTRAGQEQIARADAYIAALDVPGTALHCQGCKGAASARVQQPCALLMERQDACQRNIICKLRMVVPH